ncbi:hypothetical protein WKI65_43920 [Streptomyces sp. MS1.AVA.3]|uniref:hypothetical protein n=1 Tax=Streptomyces decoyicus TaxID=249567 RepID=UPI0030BF703A
MGVENEELVNLREYGDLIGMPRQRVQSWHATGKLGGVGPPASLDPPKYPKWHAITFGKAVGLLDDRGQRVDLEITGRWFPPYPTVSPEDSSPRFYRNHIAALFRVSELTAKAWMHDLPSYKGLRPYLGEPHKDELGRDYYSAAELNEFARIQRKWMSHAAVPRFARKQLNRAEKAAKPDIEEG